MSRMLIALGAGSIGSIGNVLAVWFFAFAEGNFSYDRCFLYKQVFWGGLWALLYCFKVLSDHWVVRGVIVGILASLVTFVVFKALPYTLYSAFKAFTVNVVVWGFLSAFLYDYCLQQSLKHSETL